MELLKKIWISERKACICAGFIFWKVWYSMLEIDNKTLRKIQMIQLEMLEEVDRICKKCNIHYNIIAGTLLGAVRHGGYIPWDDDADVAMLRKEYEKFRKACKTELDTTRFEFQDDRRTKGYRWGYGKLRRKDTLFLREFQEHMPYFQGIFIDVFPLDAVPDNFLFYSGADGEQLQLTDWEYAGMQDPHVDIAMFCIYSLYNKRQIDRLISIYFEGDCPNETRVKIYCYIAACGLLWSNWCEYKRSLGVEFGEYSLRQYRFAKEYYRIASEEIINIQ